jgi:hypothetical protein
MGSTEANECLFVLFAGNTGSAAALAAVAWLRGTAGFQGADSLDASRADV